MLSTGEEQSQDDGICTNISADSPRADYFGTDLTRYSRHPDFWLEDGNIILVASESVAFRVHRSVLSRKSGVFQDMFSFPQPSTNSDPTLLPVLQLPDSPEDLSYFFDAIYNGMK